MVAHNPILSDIFFKKSVKIRTPYLLNADRCNVYFIYHEVLQLEAECC